MKIPASSTGWNTRHFITVTKKPSNSIYYFIFILIMGDNVYMCFEIVVHVICNVLNEIFLDKKPGKNTC